MTLTKDRLNKDFIKNIKNKFKKGTHPNTFIIGAPKCGTTSIFRYLALNQEIFAPDVKEPSFFSDLETAQHKLDWFIKLYEQAEHKIRLDSTAINIYGSQDLPNIINSIDSSSKIIVVLRDPVKRFISFFGFLKHMNIINSDIDINDFIDSTLENIQKNSSLLNSDYHIDSPRYSDSTLQGGFYADHLKHWHDVFQDRMKVFFFDDLYDSPQNIMANIANFLEIENIWSELILETENKTLRPRSQTIHNILIWLYSHLEVSLNKRKTTKRLLLNAYIALNNKKKQVLISDDVNARLKSIYEQDLKNTSLFLNDSNIHCGTLPHWMN